MHLNKILSVHQYNLFWNKPSRRPRIFPPKPSPTGMIQNTFQQQQMMGQQQQQTSTGIMYTDYEEKERLRFQIELEFVQCLANPNYLNFLAQRGYFKVTQ